MSATGHASVMEPKVVAQQLTELNEAKASERLLRSAVLGDELQSSLAHGSALARISKRVAAYAGDHDCDAIMGASELGQRVAGAAVALAENGLRAFDGASGVKRALIVDGLFVTGSQLNRARRYALEAGAKDVSALVLLSVVEDPRIPGVDEAVAVLGV